MIDAKAERTTLIRDPNFRWLLVGGGISMLGDQFSLLALPWLVLKMTGDTFATGMVIALVGVPRAIFMLIGGALVDRYSPKRVLMLTKYANAVLLGLLAFLVLDNHLTLSVVYGLALGIGLASAFSIPSGTAVLPHVIPPRQLQMANSLQMGTRQLTFLAGPLLAGLLIAQGGGTATGAVADARGLGLAFGIDCLSFIVSAWTLAKVRVPLPTAAPNHQAILSAVGSGLAMVWRDREMRTCFGYWALIIFCIGGSMQVALPVLASTQLGGASAFGILLAAHGAGTLIGMVATGIIGQRRIGGLGTTILLIDAIAGVLLMPMGSIAAVWQGVILMLAIGVLAGFVQVAVLTWLQRRVPPAMLGRTMSIFMFIFMGLAPLSALSTGWLMQYVNLSELFLGSGGFLLGVAVLAFMFTPMRRITDSFAVVSGDERN
jgi:hypothetical protein